MDGVTVNVAAQRTGWSPRMLRYIEGLGLVAPDRTAGRYRVYDEDELGQLRALRSLRAEHGVDLAGLAFARRLRREPALRTAVDRWLVADERARRSAWLAFEQQKALRLLAA